MIFGYRLYRGSWVFANDPHKERMLSRESVSSLLVHGGIMVRNTYDFDCNEETSFWYVIKDSFGGMEELSSNMRNQVRKCFKYMSVDKITPKFIIENGYDVYIESSESYKVKASNFQSRQEFESRIKNSEENEYWGCFDLESGKLVAFSMNAVGDESCEYRTMKAIPEYRKKFYAYYGLIYEMNRYYLKEKGLKYVNDGARSITNHSNMQPFLIDKFKFKKAYCHFRIYYNGWMNIAVKFLYPFRKIIKLRQVSAVLDMEAMSRNEI